MDMKTSLLRIAAALAVPLLAVTACSSGSDAGSTTSGSSSGARGDVVPGAAEAPGRAAGGAADAADGLSGSAPDAKPAALQQPAIISTGAVALRAGDVAEARAQVQHVAASYGGQVTDQETSTADDGRLGYAQLTLRIPARSFSQAVSALEKVADLVDSSTTSEDVSTQVIDVDERVKAARASIDRIRTLLSRAERIGDVMAIESQLASREADLNSLLRQQAHLADQTSLSTITVSIDRRTSAGTRRAADDTGFLAGLRGGWHALEGFATGVATAVGALLPWVPVILLVGIPVWLLVRRLRRSALTPDLPNAETPAAGS